MITNAMIGYEYRNMIRPVSGSSPGTGTGTGTGTNINITLEELQNLYTIQSLYTSHLAAADYEQIPTDMTSYLKLRSATLTARMKYGSNPALAVLFQITVDSITGAINAYGLNSLNIETQIQNTYLQTTIQEIISGVNVTKAFSDTDGTLSMSRSFNLAPLFRYYISIYGMPASGAGFEPTRLSLILAALERSGIDPYNG
jgi:hypothetical protein